MRQSRRSSVKKLSVNNAKEVIEKSTTIEHVRLTAAFEQGDKEVDGLSFSDAFISREYMLIKLAEGLASFASEGENFFSLKAKLDKSGADTQALFTALIVVSRLLTK